ncbi:MAG: PBP1A family penicillin-binding protein [Actinobacteria bacterium]|nr:PBP1A family penicillin-binding protein [Actinomycetota bacterium]
MTARWAGVVIAALLLGSSCSLAPVDLEAKKALALRTTITASDGTRLARIYKPSANRSLIPIHRVPKHLKDAVLAAEDARFFDHSGYDLRSIARAAVVNLSEGRVVEGGSTITQQYVKNTYFRRPAKTLERKARELRLAIELEHRYSKREILGLYLNTVYMGEGAYGIKAAAETYFRAPVDTLTLPQAALLAAVIKAPAVYDPRDHPARARTRRNYVIDRMVTLEMITKKVGKRAKASPLGLSRRPPKLSVEQPYFVEAVKREVLDDERIGATSSERANALYRGGLQIRTTLKPRFQNAAEDAVRELLDRPGDPEAALVAIEPLTGRVVAMVGGRSWARSQVNLALGQAGGGSGRQPGSAMKPIVAAAALESGISIDDEYESSPATFRLPDGSTWSVNNAEGGGSGLLSIYDALVGSVNGVFARLSLDVGPDVIATQAEVMGVTARLPIYPSIGLGASEVSVLDMATAYATLANGGTYVEPTTIEEVRTAAGDIIGPDQETVPGVVARGNVFLLTKAMQEVIGRGTGRAAFIGRPAAGKTGTTDDHADAWFVGFTPDLVAAVWVGYPHGRIPMRNVHGMTVSGGTFPAMIWRNFMLRALSGTPPRDFNLPNDEVVTVRIDPESGLLAGRWCTGERRRLIRQFVPRSTCPPPIPGSNENPSPPTASPSPTNTKDDKKSKNETPRPEPEPTPSG